MSCPFESRSSFGALRMSPEAAVSAIESAF